jgi:hypothetical protein
MSAHLTIPAGIIIAWPGTAASIPTGWSRVTDLDGIFPKGIPTAATEPGDTGGAATHAHASSGSHSHWVGHAHSLPATTDSSASTNVRTLGDSSPTTARAGGHSWWPDANTLSSSAGASGTASPSTDAASNLPPYYDVIWLSSDGTPEGIPTGALVLYLDSSTPSGYTLHSAAHDRFLRGASGTDGGGTGGSADSHTHGLEAHTHTQPEHRHIVDTVSGHTATPFQPGGGGATAASTSGHNHGGQFYSDYTTADPLTGGSGGTSGSWTTALPPYTTLAAIEKTSGSPDLPAGIIALWRGSLASIPEDWAVCDGTNGTPNLLGRYARPGASGFGGLGGESVSHNHTEIVHSNHTAPSHSHTGTSPASTNNWTDLSNAATTTTAASGSHTHTFTTDSTTPTVGSTSAFTALSATEPPFEEVVFIMYAAVTILDTELVNVSLLFVDVLEATRELSDTELVNASALFVDVLGSDVNVHPFWIWRFVRQGGNLFVVPLKSRQTWADAEVVSENFRYTSVFNLHVMNSVASAWAAHAGSDATILKAAIDAALSNAGYKDPKGDPL